jgi:hypothetical protein
VTSKYLISGDNTGTIYIWEILTEKIIKKLEHDPILSVRSLDILQNDQSQIMVVFSGRAKVAKSFITIYNINDILKYGETNSEEEKTPSLVDVTAETLKKVKLEGGENAKDKASPVTSSSNSTSGNSNNSSLFANLMSMNPPKGNDFNHQQNPKPSFTAGKSIYDEENSIYSIYANKPKENNNQNSNYKFNNNQNNTGSLSSTLLYRSHKQGKKNTYKLHGMVFNTLQLECRQSHITNLPQQQSHPTLQQKYDEAESEPACWESLQATTGGGLILSMTGV